MGVTLTFIKTDTAKPAPRAVTFLFLFAALSFFYTTSHSADLPSSDGYAFVTPVAVEPSGWRFRFTPYAWAPSVNGDVTVRAAGPENEVGP